MQAAKRAKSSQAALRNASSKAGRNIKDKQQGRPRASQAARQQEQAVKSWLLLSSCFSLVKQAKSQAASQQAGSKAAGRLAERAEPAKQQGRQQASSQAASRLLSQQAAGSRQAKPASSESSQPAHIS
jgi:hypothetical protein